MRYMLHYLDYTQVKLYTIILHLRLRVYEIACYFKLIFSTRSLGAVQLIIKRWLKGHL